VTTRVFLPDDDEVVHGLTYRRIGEQLHHRAGATVNAAHMAAKRDRLHPTDIALGWADARPHDRPAS
jgi:hypothetical protein